MNQPGNHPKDKYLVDLVLGGDKQAFGTIIKNTEALVAQIVYKMIPNAEDRKDLVQEIYLKVFHKLEGFKFHAKLSTWIATIAYNSCLTWLEKKKLVFPDELREIADLQEVAVERLHQNDLSGILKTEIERLPPVYRTLITLYHQEELSYQEIAEITCLPEGTVKSYLFRARKNLKDSLLSKYKKEAL